LVEPATSLKEWLGAPPWLEQVAFARFIEDGGYSRHLRRVGKVMTQRRAALIEGLRGHFETATTHEPTAEDHVGWSFPAHFAKAGTIRDHARAEGIALDIFEHGAPAESTDPECGLCLGYARMNEHQIAAGLRRLAAVIDGAGAA
jgi:GntR family transcriptional regulator/MocR family aminotransferase